MWNFETDVIQDASTCPKKFRACAIWLRFDPKCTASTKPGVTLGCEEFLRQSRRQVKDGGLLNEGYVVDDVVVRGVVWTVRRGAIYDKSLPKSARIGFGHLSAFPTEIEVEELQLEPVR